MPYSKEDTQLKFKNICNTVLKTYDNEMHNYLQEAPEGTLTDADVILMIMNVTIAIGTNLYFSLRKYMPRTKIDFKYMRATIINHLSNEFLKIKEFKPEEDMIQLTNEQLLEIKDKGFFMLKQPDGSSVKITAKDLLFKKDEIDKYLAEQDAKKEIKNAADTPRIITPGC